MHILFVCTGNICRSPTAERLATAYGSRYGLTDFTASSAGTRALVAHPIHPEAALVLSRLGGDASEFASRQVTPAIAADADLVLTMTRDHRTEVLRLAPKQLHRAFTLHEAARLVSECGACSLGDLAALRPQLATDGLFDIADPIGRDATFYANVGAEIASLLPPVLEVCQNN